VIPPFPVYLFDVDGTLLDSAVDICGAIREALAGTGVPPLPDDFLKRYIGRHLLDLFHDVLPGASPEEVERLIADYRRLYPARGHAATRVYPGVKEALARLPGLKSTATTKGTASTRAVLDQFGLLEHFHHVQGTDGFPAKPAPDVILASLAALGVKPGDCLMVGDAPTDMEAGRRAGTKICAVRYGYGKVDDLARFEPDYWIDDLRDLAVLAASG